MNNSVAGFPQRSPVDIDGVEIVDPNEIPFGQIKMVVYQWILAYTTYLPDRFW